MHVLAPSPLQMHNLPLSTLTSWDHSWPPKATAIYLRTHTGRRLHPLAKSHSTHEHVHKHSCPWFTAGLGSTLWSTHYHNLRLGWIKCLASFDEAPGDSLHLYHGVPPLHQWSGGMDAQAVEGRANGTQSPVTMDQSPPPGLTGDSLCTQRRHRLH